MLPNIIMSSKSKSKSKRLALITLVFFFGELEFRSIKATIKICPVKVDDISISKYKKQVRALMYHYRQPLTNHYQILPNHYQILNIPYYRRGTVFIYPLNMEYMRPCKIQCTFDCHHVDKIIAHLFVDYTPPPLGFKKTATDTAYQWCRLLVLFIFF